MMLDPNLIILTKVKGLIILAMIKDLIIKSQDGTKMFIIILIIKITAIIEIANPTTIPWSNNKNTNNRNNDKSNAKVRSKNLVSTTQGYSDDAPYDLDAKARKAFSGY